MMKFLFPRLLAACLLAFHLQAGATVTEKPKPALLPEPMELAWREAQFDLSTCTAIICADATLRPEALRLQASLHAEGFRNIRLLAKGRLRERVIVLEKASIPTPVATNESYTIDVSEKAVKITTPSAHGAFNALQTFRQLTSGGFVQGSAIRDWPAFSWRSYMVDVGRNYQPMDLLRQQIDVMSRYKLNVFHFHFTEDVAWRLHFKRYPQLTEARHMIRQKGKFYTEKDLHELIRYCRERHIELVPEIDMPGHSAAFRRAMGYDMQSDSGMAIVAQIVKDFCREYDLPYLHIGADEVKITNPRFLPEMTRLAESLGKKVIGWMPGGNFPESVIRQLWSEGTVDHGNDSIQYIDSRQLYINHMDPLESVISIYQRQFCNTPAGDASALGATLCLWHDR
uniref:family 20 glycosylhydrolase n=1 Tax=Chitinophaga sp. TaxID=1869181 RepID=UPI0026395FBA